MFLGKPLFNTFTLTLSLVLVLGSCMTKRMQFISRSFKDKNNIVLPYQIFYPQNYKTKGIKSPLVIFLHGAGERGNDNTAQLIHVVPYLTSKEIQDKFNFVLYAPQCPTEDYWAPVKRMEWYTINDGKVTPGMQANISMMERLLKDPNIDTNRVYVIGLSMGGFGTTDLLSRKPEWFAAAIPICGGADLSKIKSYAAVPLWIFHGANDNVVPASISQDLYNSRKALDYTQTMYHEFPNGNHGVWEQAIRYPLALEWLFAQKKAKID